MRRLRRWPNGYSQAFLALAMRVALVAMPVLLGCGESGAVGPVCQPSQCQVPSPVCLDAQTLISSRSRGCGGDGRCLFEEVQTLCKNGCADGGCIGESCAGKLCESPPAPLCQDASTLRVFASPGGCADGQCLYAHSDIPCPEGCQDGECVQDFCAGVRCEAPPSASCLDATTAAQYLSPGQCSPASGQCGYTRTEVACGSGQLCQAGQCVTPPPSCGPGNCAGCCDGTTCIQGSSQSNTQCGQGGLACAACASTSPCTNLQCVDIDECAIANGGCSPSASCTDTVGGRACACKPGYSGDGFVCTASCGQGCTPPPSTCADATTVRTYSSSCVDGSCQDNPTDTPCAASEASLRVRP